MSSCQLAVVLKGTRPERTATVRANARGGAPAGECTRIRELGYRASAHAKLYGEKFLIVSDPFPLGSCVAVRVVTATNPAIRTLRLPVAILLSLSNFFPKRPGIGSQSDRPDSKHTFLKTDRRDGPRAELEGAVEVFG